MAAKMAWRFAAAAAVAHAASAPPPATNLLVEYMEDPIVLDIAKPRFFWLVDHTDRGVSQKAYRIVVNSTTTGRTVWDSGLVTSSQTIHVEYAGEPLESDNVYRWAVQWTDSNGAAAPWSDAGTFGMGLLTQAEWAPSSWIGCPLKNSDADPSYNQLRAEFDLGAPEGVTITQARMYITAIGYYNVRVNGDWAPQWQKHRRPRLDPGWTTYEVRSLYNAYDLTNVLKAAGPNAFAVSLGNGWPDISPVPGNKTQSAAEVSAWEQPEVLDEAVVVARRMSGADPVQENTGLLRQLRMQVHIRTSDGKTTIWSSSAGSAKPSLRATAGDWRCGAGALQYDNLYNGCTVDARLETVGWDVPGYGYSNGKWTSAVPKSNPGGRNPAKLTAQNFPAITVQQELSPKSISAPSPGVFVIDFGQNLAGVVRLRLPAPVTPGLTIKIRHAELLQHPPYGPQDGNIYVGNLRAALNTDVYITRGAAEGEVFEPVFTYHGFRYVEISGLPYPPTEDMVTALYLRTSIPLAGTTSFPSGAANVLNQLQHAVTWGIGSNLMSVISDCPQRDERKGWLGDSALSLLPMQYNYAMGSMLTAWAQNIRDSQEYQGDPHPAGTIPDTVPHTFGSYPSDPAWGSAFPGTVAEMLFFQGDVRLAEDMYPNLQAYIEYLAEQVNQTGIGHLYEYYGDWCPPPAQPGTGQGPKPPKSMVPALALLVDLHRMADIAKALGKADDSARYSDLRQKLLNDFNAAWLNADSGRYGNVDGSGLQTANAGALFVGAAEVAGDEVCGRAAKALAEDLGTTHKGHWSVGIIGMRYLHSALTAFGSGDLAVESLLKTEYPGYGWAFNNDLEPATTLWELPDAHAEGPGMNSRNHHMFASVGGWLYEDLAGIGQVRRAHPKYDPADASQRGFRHPVLFPRASGHPAVGFGQAEYRSISGRYAISWVNLTSTTLSGATCAENAAEGASAEFSCSSGGTFSSVDFASFGTPSGSCAAGFSASSCHAANTTDIIASACLGKSTCSINIADTTFGDPCFGTLKWLSAKLVCSTSSSFTITATVPANGRATVRLPFVTGTDLQAVTISEGGAVIWSKGAFVPGVLGVLAASVGPAADTPPGLSTVDVEVAGAGTFVFTAA